MSVGKALQEFKTQPNKLVPVQPRFDALEWRNGCGLRSVCVAAVLGRLGVSCANGGIHFEELLGVPPRWKCNKFAGSPLNCSMYFYVGRHSLWHGTPTQVDQRPRSIEVAIPEA